MPKKIIIFFFWRGVLSSFFFALGSPFWGIDSGWCHKPRMLRNPSLGKTDTPALKDSATSELAGQDEKLV